MLLISWWEYLLEGTVYFCVYFGFPHVRRVQFHLSLHWVSNVEICQRVEVSLSQPQWSSPSEVDPVVPLHCWSFHSSLIILRDFIIPAAFITWNCSIKNFSLVTDGQFHNIVHIRKIEKMHDFIHFQNQTLTSSIRSRCNYIYIVKVF